ncbi:PREDICTED: cytosolic sulfotransferase 18-like [Camelina sativa]|uniref:Sulfotransferase n=1 Tax=Camelina sativa TaxID=90675 RepID=A0ABM0TEV8_CAMSA|nr:PREDICTED: cytosolic sulfotransferase 18-like [Camelina sativa]
MESEMTILPSHQEETKTEFEKNQKRYQDLIATFPHVEGWFSKAPLIEYGGYWFIQPVLEGCLYAQNFFQARSIDILVCTYPKSGTTWLKALTFTTANRTRFEDDDSSNPLLKHNPHELVPFIETDFALFPKGDALKEKENTLFATHIPHDLLPKSVAKSGCKIVYIWRDPKDAFISKWAFFEKEKSDVGSLNSLEESFDMFCRGISLFGPYLDHVLGYWKTYQEHPDKVLFLKYETMRADPLPHVKRLAQFMGYGFTAEEEEKGVVEKVVKLCSFETLKNLDVNQADKNREISPSVYYPNSAFFRKGKVGDWQNYLTQEMAARIDGLMQEKFKGSGLLEHGNMTD